MNIDFSKSPLVPAIVRDARSGAVLMLAYMNEESLARSIATNETWFWSRSRQELWNKGATSGNRQKIVKIATDCDRDALLIDVEPAGPACHDGRLSCFGDGPAAPAEFDIAKLLSVLKSRRATRPEGSYTATLFGRGTNAILKKIGEEATEVILAAKGEGRERLISEIADLAFHTLLLMVDQEIEPDDILRELAGRERRGAGDAD